MKFVAVFIGLIVLVACKTVDIVEYEYKSTTMLGSRTITIRQDSVVTAFNGRGEATRTARATTPKEWQKLKESAKGLKLEDISTLESPTDRRSTDAAPYGSVIITTKDSTYRSASFDGFDAHAKLLPLVNAIKEISESKTVVKDN